MDAEMLPFFGTNVTFQGLHFEVGVVVSGFS